jgi:uncharacterized membrane protein HdeD (DUF308 family)
MIDLLARNWRWVALRGVVALLFGLLTLFRPGISLAALVLLFGAYAFADGVLMVVAAIARRHGEPRWVALLVGGLAGIAVGILTLLMPAITAVGLLGFVALWAIFTGIAEVVAAIRLRKVITGEWRFVLAGALAVAFGVLIFLAPAESALVMMLWVGAYAVVSGVLLLAFAFRLRNWWRQHPGDMAPRPA